MENRLHILKNRPNMIYYEIINLGIEVRMHPRGNIQEMN
jgi:hypothetical protein